MEEAFILEVAYKGTRYNLPAQLQLTGYTYRFVVSLTEADMWFEKDEEGAYRALLPPHADAKLADKLEAGFIEAIALQLEAISK